MNGVPATASDYADSNRPDSVADSQDHPTPSITTSRSGLSLEERLKRMRATDELRQQQRLAAFVESQRLADLARLKSQEDRKRKMEEMHQRAEARRQTVIERRKTLELNNHARLSGLRDRSRARDAESATLGRYHPKPAGALRGFEGRTASASPSLGTARNPSQLMTSSCVVAFGSSAPRSICTQFSPAAIRCRQAFEARLASYLTGRHSGCFLTHKAKPYYLRLMTDTHPSEQKSLTQTGHGSCHGTATTTTSSNHSAPIRRARSAHPSLLRQTQASLARSVRNKHHDQTSLDRARPTRANRRVELRPSNITRASKDADPTNNERSAVMHEAHTTGRPPRTTSKSVGCRPERMIPNRRKIDSSTSQSITGSVDESEPASSRSNSIDALPNRVPSTQRPSVFDRLALQGAKRNRSTKTSTSQEEPMKSLPRTDVRRLAEAPPAPKRPQRQRPFAKGMSASVHIDHRPATLGPMKPTVIRKRSASPVTLKTTTKTSQPKGAPTSLPHTALLDVANAGGDVELESSPSTPAFSADSVENLGPSDEHPLDRLASTQSSEDPNTAPTDTISENLTETGNLATEIAAPPAAAVESTPAAPTSTPTTTTPAPLSHVGPLKAEIQGGGEGGALNENEAAIYRAKLGEQRRLAKERKEEEQRRVEEEQARRRQQQELARLASEREAQEQAALAAAEADLALRQKEEDEKARLRDMEAERLAKLQRAEEERVMRKKRLESIMSRVKQPGGTNDKLAAPSSSPPPPSSMSTPALMAQSVEPGEATVTAGPDASDPGPMGRAEPVEEPESPQPTATQSFSLLDGEDAVNGVPQVENNDHAPVVFTLNGESEGKRQQADDLVTTNGIADSINNDGTEVVEHNGLEHDAGNTTDDTPKTEADKPQQADSGVASVKPASLPGSPLKSLATSGSSEGTGSRRTSETPVFKSALLQSMMTGGRLSARAKDAVAELRRGSSSSTQLADMVPSNGDGENSSSSWMRANPSGDALLPHDDQVSSTRSLSDRPSDSLMVQSMYDQPIDRYHMNGSGTEEKASDSPNFAWSIHRGDRDISSPEPINSSPVPLSTSTH